MPILNSTVQTAAEILPKTIEHSLLATKNGRSSISTITLVIKNEIKSQSVNTIVSHPEAANKSKNYKNKHSSMFFQRIPSSQNGSSMANQSECMMH